MAGPSSGGQSGSQPSGGRVAIVRGDRDRHADACAAILNDWIDATEWMPRIHSLDSVRWFVRDVVFAMRRVWVAEAANGQAIGFLALDIEATITAFYVAANARGHGIGRRLLDAAKREESSLELWTFQPNTGARRFYEREGFHEVRRTEGDNEEGMPDMLLRWNA